MTADTADRPLRLPPYVRLVVSHGRRYFYFRSPLLVVRLPDDPRSKSFRQAHATAAAELRRLERERAIAAATRPPEEPAPPAPAADRPKPKTATERVHAFRARQKAALAASLAQPGNVPVGELSTNELRKRVREQQARKEREPGRKDPPPRRRAKGPPTISAEDELRLVDLVRRQQLGLTRVAALMRKPYAVLADAMQRLDLVRVPANPPAGGLGQGT